MVAIAHQFLPCAHPERAVLIFGETADGIAHELGGIRFVEYGKFYPIKARQPIPGADPHAAITGLFDTADPVLRQAVVRGPVPDAESARRRGCLKDAFGSGTRAPGIYRQ